MSNLGSEGLLSLYSSFDNILKLPAMCLAVTYTHTHRRIWWHGMLCGTWKCKAKAKDMQDASPILHTRRQEIPLSLCEQNTTHGPLPPCRIENHTGTTTCQSCRFRAYLRGGVSTHCLQRPQILLTHSQWKFTKPGLRRVPQTAQDRGEIAKDTRQQLREHRQSHRRNNCVRSTCTRDSSK